MPFADVRRRHVRLFWVTVTEVCSRLHLDEHAPRRAKGLDESFEQVFVSCRVLRTRVDHCGIAEFFVRLAVWRLLARLHRLAGNIEREAEAALNCNAHRPRLHLHIIPHGDRIQEGASPLLADCDEPNRLAPAFVDALASETFAKLDDAARIAKNKAVVSTNAILETLETNQGKLFWQNSSLLSAAVRYLGPDAELAGYEALRLTNELNSVTQYRSGQWHHDRCGARLKAFLFLHDVGKGARPTQVARGSHRTLYWSYHDMGESRFSDEWVARNYDIVNMGGPKGGGFVFDTNALHRGVETLLRPFSATRPASITTPNASA